jgi:hypothetical protein
MTETREPIDHRLAPSPWQAMTLTAVGTFGDVMLGGTGKDSDGKGTTTFKTKTK